MRRHYRLKRDALLVLLEAHLARWFDWKKPRGGMHVLIEIKPEFVSLIGAEIVLDQWIAQDITKNDILLSTLSEHFAQKQHDDGRFGFVLGFSGPSEEKMRKIIIALETWFTEALGNV
tara:strand:- start:246 stop:599 length:354 start_codon:yes stop_codon:yes gene_type:complete